MMTSVEIDVLAERIAKALFTNGNGDHARRLVLELGGSRHDGGGWSEKGATDQIAAVLTQELGR